MTKRIQTMALLVAAGALLAVPAIGQADKPNAQGNHNHANKGKGKGKGKGKAKCVVNKGFVVKGTLTSATTDLPGTPNVDEASVTIAVTGANRHARNAGVKVGESYTADHTRKAGNPLADTADPFTLVLSGFEGSDTPSVGDKVRVQGKVPVTRKKCATADQDTVAERYGDENIRRVKIVDGDPDLP